MMPFNTGSLFSSLRMVRARAASLFLWGWTVRTVCPANPVRWEPNEQLAELVGPRLRLIYLTACDGGQKATQWEEVFAPAHVISFDRLSAVLEHVYWLWRAGPSEIRALR